MFGLHITIAESGSRLVVVSPADTVMLILFMIFTVWPLVIFLCQRPLPVRRVAIFSAITLAFYGYFIDCTRLTMDKTTQMVCSEHFKWFHWTSQKYPLADVAYAYLASGRASDRLVLQYQNGDTRSLSVSNQMGDKPAAVLAINKFLGHQP